MKSRIRKTKFYEKVLYYNQINVQSNLISSRPNKTIKTGNIKLMTTNICKTIIVTVCCIGLFAGCVTTNNNRNSNDKDLLRVGVSANYPPIIYKQNRKIVGVEADLARALAITLNKRLEFVEIKWKDLIPALKAGKIDIIMSGMSVTMPRSMQLSFTEPYLRNGLMTAVPNEKIGQYRTPADILFHRGPVGVIKGTTSEEFARRFLVNSEIVLLKKSEDAAHYFDGKRITMFIHDAYAIGWLISQNESELAGIWTPLSNDYFAWGVSRTNPELLKEVNNVLKGWKSNGSLKKMLDTWLPLRKNIKWNNYADATGKVSSGILGY
ncbi:MAG: transporter substrate-binding domain-containing protein [Kiritimatiellae bacterium]|nr:transporter substrate-binding domain-containing protein [Kiritimatiellia bacterium]